MNEESVMRWMPAAGGVLNIISGLLGLLASLFLFFFGFFMRAITSFSSNPDEAAVFVWWIVGAFYVLLSIAALVGGIFALRRKSWGLALAGSICAILQVNPLGIVSTAFIAMSKKEFTNREGV